MSSQTHVWNFQNFILNQMGFSNEKYLQENLDSDATVLLRLYRSGMESRGWAVGVLDLDLLAMTSLCGMTWWHPCWGLSARVFWGTHKPSTWEPDWSARQPGFSEEDPAQRGPAHQEMVISVCARRSSMKLLYNPTESISNKKKKVIFLHKLHPSEHTV